MVIWLCCFFFSPCNVTVVDDGPDRSSLISCHTTHITAEGQVVHLTVLIAEVRNNAQVNYKYAIIVDWSWFFCYFTWVFLILTYICTLHILPWTFWNHIGSFCIWNILIADTVRTCKLHTKRIQDRPQLCRYEVMRLFIMRPSWNMTNKLNNQ